MRAAARVLLTLVALGILVFLGVGYWASSRVGSRPRSAPSEARPSGSVDVAAARQRGAELAERAALAAAEVKETLADGALTAKIIAKMALDDSVRALAIDVTTSRSTVTLTGKVNSAAERQRAVSLARETEGVAAVVDRLEIRRSGSASATGR